MGVEVSGEEGARPGGRWGRGALLAPGIPKQAPPGRLNEAGEQTAWQARGFAARIVQHEMDHLKGILYVDKMESGSFTCLHWAKVNR
ncbi:Peptide deformylase, mitochondrial, partial [Ophiophagus hannah]